ncbi:MAG: nitrilase-related carbon-nitrogen hydrolase, partial [Methyloligellaceae bacterium]
GHSLIVSPWGDIIAEAGLEPGIIFADIDLAEVEDARRRIPSLQHDRDDLREIVYGSKDMRAAS